MMHITVLLLYLNHNSTYYKLTDQLESIQRSTSGKEKIAGANKTSVSNPMIKPPATPAVKIACYRLQSVALRLHGIPLILGLEIEPHTDSMSSQRYYLYKRSRFCIVKDIIISYVPNGPK
jgi:hypothetical protein